MEIAIIPRDVPTVIQIFMSIWTVLMPGSFNLLQIFLSGSQPGLMPPLPGQLPAVIIRHGDLHSFVLAGNQCVMLVAPRLLLPFINMKLLICFTCFSILVSLGFSSVFAQQEPAGRPQRLHPAAGAIDLNDDGVISETEIKKASQSLLGLDSNKDGALSHDELIPAGLRRGDGGGAGRGGAGRGGAGAGRGGAGRGGAGAGRGGGGPRPNDLGASSLELGAAAIAWYPRLEDGMAEAKRTNRPIIFMAAASQCGGVPGVF